MERLKERVDVADRALATLEELLARPPTSRVERDASIQRFEYSFEAVWRTAQRHLQVVEGVVVGSPKACVRASREADLLSDEQSVAALEMVDDRNLTVHTYNEEVAQRIFANLPRYSRLLREWLTAIAGRS